jgi:hypothetical protein
LDKFANFGVCVSNDTLKTFAAAEASGIKGTYLVAVEPVPKAVNEIAMTLGVVVTPKVLLFPNFAYYSVVHFGVHKSSCLNHFRSVITTDGLACSGSLYCVQARPAKRIS